MIEFNEEQLYWIERTADIESSNVTREFTDLINKIDINKLDDKQKTMFQNISSELIDLYGFLRVIRTKCENERMEKQFEKQFKRC